MVSVALGAFGLVGGDEQLVVRNEARRTADDVLVDDEKSYTFEPLAQLRRDELVHALAIDGNTE
jgi:hypothetical protein